MTRGFKLGAAVIALSAAVGCAKDPTTILIGVGTDSSVPPLLILGIDVVSATDPTRTLDSRLMSQVMGDAADRPAPFLFPLLLPVTVDASFAGPVMVTVEGIDWDSNAVLASGSTPADVVAQQSTMAFIVLTAATAPPGDGGSDGGSDAGAD